MNCLIVDDDACTRIDLEKKVSKISFLSHVGSCDSVWHTPDILLKSRVDLLFLDVLMPGTTGLQFLESIASHPVQVILMSSDPKYAVDAFERAVVDFLLKPISDERFFKAVKRAYSRYNGSRLEKHASRKDHLFIKTNGVYFRLQTSSIQYIEAQPDHILLVTDTGSFKIQSTLKHISDNIPFDHFCRVHNSFIVNIHKISGLEDNIVTVQKKTIPVSRSRHSDLISRLNMI